MCILNVAEKSIYVLLWLDENILLRAFTTEKPATNFLTPAINQKKNRIRAICSDTVNLATGKTSGRLQAYSNYQ